MKWLLIVFIMSPNDEYVTKVTVPFPSEVSCMESLNAMPEHGEEGGFWDSVCVTKEHYEGSEYIEDVPLD